MSNHLKWLPVVLFSAAVLGGVYVASAQDKDKPKEPVSEKKVAEIKTADDVQKALTAKVTFDGPLAGLEFGDFLDKLSGKSGVTIRIDTAPFIRREWSREQVQAIEKVKLFGRGKPPAVMADLLREALAQVQVEGQDERQRLSYRIKGSEILIVPEHKPSTLPVNRDDDAPTFFVKPEQMLEDTYGEPVTVRYKNKPLAEVIADLQERTGANIVAKLNTIPEPDKATVTANFNDTRLLTALKVISEIHGLKPVVIDNVFFLTDRDRANKLQAEVNRDLYGEPPPAVPAGFVTDGYKLYPKTADMKPADNQYPFGGGVIGMPGKPFRAKPVPAPDTKKDEPKKEEPMPKK